MSSNQPSVAGLTVRRSASRPGHKAYLEADIPSRPPPVSALGPAVGSSARPRAVQPGRAQSGPAARCPAQPRAVRPTCALRWRAGGIAVTVTL